jgi:NADH:ubiquinone oxidoreductase subunit 6 (subunit J)
VKKWYHSTLLLILVFIVFFPAGFVMLWKNPFIRLHSKIGVSVAIGILVIAVAMRKDDPNKSAAQATQTPPVATQATAANTPTSQEATPATDTSGQSPAQNSATESNTLTMDQEFGQHTMADYVACYSAAISMKASCDQDSAEDTTKLTPDQIRTHKVICGTSEWMMSDLYPQAMNYLISSGKSTAQEKETYQQMELQKAAAEQKTWTGDQIFQEAYNKLGDCADEHKHLEKFIAKKPKDYIGAQ